MLLKGGFYDIVGIFNQKQTFLNHLRCVILRGVLFYYFKLGL